MYFAATTPLASSIYTNEGKSYSNLHIANIVKAVGRSVKDWNYSAKSISLFISLVSPLNTIFSIFRSLSRSMNYKFVQRLDLLSKRRIISSE